jgi:hypothetical protein
VITVDLLPQEETVVRFENNNYKAVLPNYGDWTFISIDLDPVSRKYFIENIPKIEEELAKMLIIRSLYNDVRLAKMRGDVFIQLLLPYFEQNLSNSTIIKQLGEYCVAALNFIPPALKDLNKQSMFDKFWELINLAEQKNVQSEFKKLCLTSASSPGDILKLYETYKEKNELSKKVKFNESEEGGILFQMISMEGLPSSLKEESLETLTQKASSSEALSKMNLQTKAFFMNVSEREEVWEQTILNKTRTRSFVDLQYMLKGLGSKFVSEEMRKEMMARYFKELPGMIQREESKIAETFLQFGKPHWDDLEEVRNGLGRSLKEIESLNNEFFDNAIKKKIDDYDQMLRAFKLF